ncbi:hypothetical protein RPW65_07100 [Pseudomonas sp. NyZ704]|nr:hypothetical protein RPW65_07100 [Pseudomonas sp. NyZ704]
MIKKFAFYISAAILLPGCLPHEERQLTDNGNLLFYNSPIAASHQDDQYITYMTNQGVIVLATMKDLEVTQNTVIHSYSADINWETGKADDHAAPSLIHDKELDRLIIATSYHGTPMYVYEYDLKSKEINLIQTMVGRYTYPRLLKHKGEIYLLSRLQPEGVYAGHLVLRKAEDDFNQEAIIISSTDGEVVYAGTPAVTEEGFIIAYSMHSYAENRLIGFDLIEYSLKNDTISSKCDLSYLISEDSHSNRPTGLGYDGKSIMVATAYSEKEQTYRSEEVGNFEGKNEVIVAKGQNCLNFKVVEKKLVSMPYYHTSIAVNDNLEYLYFDENKYHSNSEFSGCFESEKMLYPNFTDKGVVYASMNRPYSMLNFDNSIFYCTLIKGE